MIFKNLQLETGDFVAFQTEAVPLPEVQAAVIGIEDGVLEVMSTLLAPFQHNGKFTEDEVGQIMVVYPSAIAIPRESRGKNFSKHQGVSVIIKGGEEHRGEVVAAFDGIVVARRSDGELITGGASHFNAVA
ncbi:MAG TPA: hypothetical protein P5096_02700 [Patescibacteria group bacterium]|nr:hypothetical protein [Patescibacteria group bacterium]